MKIRKPFFILLALPLLFLTLGFVNDLSDDYFEISKNLDIFGRLYREVNSLYVEETDPSELMRIGVDAMLESLDPYTTYISESELDDLNFMSTGEYGGIGDLVNKIKGRFVIDQAYKGAPADRAGLKPGDVILQIGETPIEEEMDMEDIRDLLRGEKSSEIDILVERPGKNEPQPISVMRDRIKVKNVPFSGMLNKKTGFITLGGFTKDASREVKHAYEALKRENPSMDGLVLDLRGNPGGRLDEAVRIVNLFVPQKEVVVETRGREENSRRVHYAQRIPLDTEIPLAILIDERSASASEIVAGALQDLDRAVIVGQRSFGKGLVQNIRPLSYHTQLKVTTAKYYTPSGRCIQALDYGEKDKNGDATRIPDSLRTSFNTRNGREVLDGGGVKPDIEISPSGKAAVIEGLLSNHLIFDFATRFAQENPSISQPRDFHVNSQIYQDFINFVESQPFSYKTASDKELDKLKEVIEKEAYTQQLEDELQMLVAKMEAVKSKDLRKHEEDIKWLLEKEILLRYYYQEGSLEAALDHDEEIEMAAKTLANKKHYFEILQGQGN